MSSGEDKERELFVASDLQSIPMFESLPMLGLGQWLSAIVLYKLLRVKPPIEFATESRRMMRVDAEQVPKRVMNSFSELRATVEQMGYRLNYYATVPSIGPVVISMMTMSSESGKSHFFAIREVIKTSDNQVVDDGYFGFASKLPDDGSLETISKARLPGPRAGVKRLMISTDSPDQLHREHNKRVKANDVTRVPASEWVDYARKQNLLNVEDFLRRGVIRPATQGEIHRIRAQRKG